MILYYAPMQGKSAARRQYKQLLIRDILGHIFQAAIQYLTQLVERVRRYRHILLQPLDGRVAHAVLEPQRIGRRSLQFHRFPQRRIANHTKAPFTGFIMTAIMAIPIWLLFSHAEFFETNLHLQTVFGGILNGLRTVL